MGHMNEIAAVIGIQSIAMKKADPLWDKFMKGVQTMYDLIVDDEYVVVASTSFGKDSSVMLSMVLHAAKLAAAHGLQKRPIIISHADTGIENPNVMMVNKAEKAKVIAYCKEHNIKMTFSHVRPRLNENYLFRIIGGNKLPTYEDGPAECSTMLKVGPQTRQAAAITKKIEGMGAGVKRLSVTGVRYEESPARKAKMFERGETDDTVAVYQGRYSIAPIANWEVDDVVMFLLNGTEYGQYSDFQAVWELYGEAGGGTCGGIGISVSDDEQEKRASKGCGARFGCSLCLRTGASDKSMENMLSFEKNAYMRELNELREYLRKIRWDMSKRELLGRSITKDGFIRVGPDNFSTETLQTLLRMVLSIQKKEIDEADSLGIAPRFMIIDELLVAGIDAQWSRYGHGRPFEAWAIYRDVMQNNNLLLPSEVDQEDVPRPVGLRDTLGFIKLDIEPMHFSPLRDVITESLGGLPAVGVKKDGSLQMTHFNESESLEFDPEGLSMFLEWELDRHLAMYHNDHTNPTAAFKTYMQLGFMTMSNRSAMTSDPIVRVTDQLWFNGLLKATADEVKEQISTEIPEYLQAKMNARLEKKALAQALRKEAVRQERIHAKQPHNQLALWQAPS